jgi:hypothetical protein
MLCFCQCFYVLFSGRGLSTGQLTRFLLFEGAGLG